MQHYVHWTKVQNNLKYTAVTKHTSTRKIIKQDFVLIYISWQLKLLIFSGSTLTKRQTHHCNNCTRTKHRFVSNCCIWRSRSLYTGWKSAHSVPSSHHIPSGKGTHSIHHMYMGRLHHRYPLSTPRKHEQTDYQSLAHTPIVTRMCQLI